MKVLGLTRYGRQGASSRLRMVQFIEPLRMLGIELVVHPLISDGMLRDRYARGGYMLARLVQSYLRRAIRACSLGGFDVAMVENELFPWLPPAFDRAVMGRIPTVVDYDDATFHKYDQHPSRLVRWALGDRIDQVMRAARSVIAGNEYVAGRARLAGAREVSEIPTVLDLSRYDCRSGERSGAPNAVRLGWIGQPTNVEYLEVTRAGLESAAASSKLTLRVIGAEVPGFAGVRGEAHPWTEETEASLLRECDIGLMPLPDAPWERGKCGYKLIQYMACGLPVLASPVGANLTIVKHGHNGFLCESPGDWERHVRALAADPALRHRMGMAGRRLVEDKYCLAVAVPRLAEVLVRAAGGT